MSPDWTPYQHGLTITRYCAALVAEAPVTVFTLVYVRTAAGGPPSKALIYVTFVTSIVTGALLGHQMAIGQYKFL